jgi:hypothetical protein
MPSIKRAASRSAAEAGGPFTLLSTTSSVGQAGQRFSHVWYPDTWIGQQGSAVPWPSSWKIAAVSLRVGKLPR